MPESVADTSAERKLEELQPYLRRQPVMLAMLAVLAIVFFVAVTGLSRAYHAQRDELGERWFTRGVADLSAKQFEVAVTEFRAALLYSRDNYTYQLNLAEALLGSNRMSEASTYLANLWERQPEDGLVNLELARIAVQKGQPQQALRYYHNSIYAAWPSDEEVKRRDARLELIEFLLTANMNAQAQSELIALAENLGDDPAQQKRVGDLFMRVQDYEHALAAYRISLKLEHDNRVPAGAGYAAFELGRYPLAERYLQTAVAQNPSDSSSAERLKMTQLVLRMDPFRRQISVAHRDKIVMEAFAAAGQRLKSCSATQGSAVPSASQSSLAGSWSSMNSRLSESTLKRNPDLVEAAMDLVFEIERRTSASCGPPTGIDMALLLIARLHEGN
jgi:tetratricopeptide (TPR) repeat protein